MLKFVERFNTVNVTNISKKPIKFCIINEHTRGCETFWVASAGISISPSCPLRVLNHSPPHILNTSTHPYPAHPPSPPLPRLPQHGELLCLHDIEPQASFPLPVRKGDAKASWPTPILKKDTTTTSLNRPRAVAPCHPHPIPYPFARWSHTHTNYGEHHSATAPPPPFTPLPAHSLTASFPLTYRCSVRHS